jgi:hypothetical protein
MSVQKRSVPAFLMLAGAAIVAVPPPAAGPVVVSGPLPFSAAARCRGQQDRENERTEQSAWFTGILSSAVWCRATVDGCAGESQTEAPDARRSGMYGGDNRSRSAAVAPPNRAAAPLPWSVPPSL